MPWSCRILLLLLLMFALTPATGLPAPQENGARDTTGYKRSDIFYDSVYRKFSRNKFTQMLYGLAFIPPDISGIPDSLQVFESQIPYIEHKGKIIRNIEIKTLPPFGASIYDTADKAQTAVGKALNGVHMKTRDYIIRRNLLFKPGQELDPFVLGDNERVIRDLSPIDNVRIIVIPAGQDSVDLVVVSKDVWSIGFDIPIITVNKLGFRLYDANFLGLGDRLTINMSTELNRAPFFRFDGASYTFTNVLGTFIDAGIAFNQDNTGNQIFQIAFDRSFLTNKIKWAGGAGAAWIRSVTFFSSTIATRYESESFWLGRAFLMKGQKQISRFVLAAAVYRREYSYRPEITYDTSRIFTNNLQFIGSLSFSQNNYYVTDYLFEFGKTENLPFGKLFQINFGPEYNEFYTRLYAGIHLSAGNFFPGFGYLQGYVKIGSFFNNKVSEDGVLKLNLRYFTPLIHMTDPRFKFRTFVTGDYRIGFNMRPGNPDYYNTDEEFNINHLNRTNAFYGTETLSSNIASIIFTPWYLYGFRFALMGQIQAGAAALKYQPLEKAPLFIGFGTGIMIKNNNLVFPTFLISGYLYPVSPQGVPSVQLDMSSVYRLFMYNFNVSAPHSESLGN